uniref:Uncharacterized protein n=1 Tax=Cannabis sativa TaxID=3483 RepID=A0A803QPQ8_CANSA
MRESRSGSTIRVWSKEQGSSLSLGSMVWDRVRGLAQGLGMGLALGLRLEFGSVRGLGSEDRVGSRFENTFGVWDPELGFMSGYGLGIGSRSRSKVRDKLGRG